ncbi:MAG: trigger factor [Candidatus Roizmanbacteria bacterium]
MSTYSYKSKTLPKSAVEIDISIQWDAVSTKRAEVIAQAITTVEVPGFRKGKAPRDLAEKQLNPDKVYEMTIRGVIPNIYDEIVAKEKLNPIASPSIDLKEAKENEHWKLIMTIPLIPVVKLKDYKKQIKNEKLKIENEAKIGKSHPVIPAPRQAQDKLAGIQKGETGDAAQEIPEQVRDDKSVEAGQDDKKATIPLSKIFEILLKESELEVPEIITQEEVNRRLTQLLEDMKKVGLTPTQYFASKKMTEEELQKQYHKDSEDMYKIEFIIAKIADTEQIKVDQTELEAILGHAKTEEERTIAARNMQWYETLLRKQKVLDFLNTL